MSKARPSARGPRKPAAKASRPAAGHRPKPSGRQPSYRMRRFPPLPWRLKAALALGWLAAVAAILYLAPTWPGRLGLIVLATAVLPLIVVLVRDPSRRTR